MAKPTKIYSSKRLKEFQDNGFTISADGELHCGVCNRNIDATKASTVRDHANSKKHKTNLNSMKSTPSVASNFEAKDIWKDLVDVFMDSGVPLKIFRNAKFREWVHKNVKSGYSMPSESSVRKMVSAAAKEDEESTKSLLKDKDVIVVADESTDLKNRKVLNILLSSAEPGSKFRLVTTKFLDEVNSATICSSVIDTIRNLSIPYNRVVCFCSDNAPYMVSAGKTLQGIFERIFHTTCWSHVLHLIGEEIRIKLPTADEYIGAFKAALVKAPTRREELMTKFDSDGHPRRLPPSPVLTRWCTWLEAGAFHFKYLQSEMDWINETTDDSAAVKKLKRLSGEKKLREELQKVADICPTISSSIKTLESNNFPSSDVWLTLKTVEIAYEKVFKGKSPKLQLYMTKKHPALEFWKDVQFFDPRKTLSVASDVSEIPASLKRFITLEIPTAEFLKLQEILKSYPTEHFCPVKFWKSYERELPALSSCAIRALSMPSSSADVERSFSALKRLLTPQRSSFTEENLCAHLKLAFNKSFLLEETENTEQVEISSDDEY